MNNNKTIEDVLKYLYEQGKDDLAKAVLDLMRRSERAEAEPKYPVGQLTQPPQIWYGDGVNPPYKITG